MPGMPIILDPCFSGSANSTGYQPPPKRSAPKQRGKKIVPNLTGVSSAVSDADRDDILVESGLEAGPSTSGGSGDCQCLQHGIIYEYTQVFT